MIGELPGIEQTNAAKEEEEENHRKSVEAEVTAKKEEWNTRKMAEAKATATREEEKHATGHTEPEPAGATNRS